MRLSHSLLTKIEAGELDLLTLLQEDPELYAEYALKIQTKGSKVIPFVYNNPQKVFHAACERMLAEVGYVRMCLLKARQWGGTTYIAGRIYQRCATRKKRAAKVITHSGEQSQVLLQMYKNFYANAPEELQPMTKYLSKAELTFANKSNTPEALRDNPGLQSSIGVYSAKTMGMGRGSTLHYLHCSEVAFWGGAGVDVGTVMLGLLNTVPSSDQEGLGTEVYVESTANGVGDYFYDLYQRAKNQPAGEQFRACFIPWYLHLEYRTKAPESFEQTLTTYERGLYQEEHPAWEHVNPATGTKRLTLDQLYWRRMTVATQCGHDESKFRQEYPITDGEAFVASGQNFFDLDLIQARISTIRAEVKPVFVGELEFQHAAHRGRAGKAEPRLLENSLSGNLTLWALPEKGQRYVYFADVSEGLKDGDYSVVDVFRVKDGFQCAQWRGHIEPDRLGEVCYDLGHYYNWAHGTPEANGHGVTTLLRLRELGYPWLYKRLVYDKAFEKPKETEGWLTTIRTRPIMLDTARRAFRDDEVVVNSLVTLEEMKTFVLLGRKFAAQQGCNDDCVMCFAGAAQMLTEIPHNNGPKVKNWMDEPASRQVKSGKRKNSYL